MISRDRTRVPNTHLPLQHLLLCLDCDECFEIGLERCPACGSATWISLSRFLEPATSARRAHRRDASASPAKRHDEQQERVQQLIIIAPDREYLYKHLKRAFAGNETVRVLLDRRVAERREHSRPNEAELRLGDRRSPRTIDGILRAIGWVIVPLGAPAGHRGSAS